MDELKIIRVIRIDKVDGKETPSTIQRAMEQYHAYHTNSFDDFLASAFSELGTCTVEFQTDWGIYRITGRRQ